MTNLYNRDPLLHGTYQDFCKHHSPTRVLWNVTSILLPWLMWPFKYTAKWLATILQWSASIGFQIKLFRSPIQLFHTICLVRLDDWIANELGWFSKQKHTLESKATKKNLHFYHLEIKRVKMRLWQKQTSIFSKHFNTIIFRVWSRNIYRKYIIYTWYVEIWPFFLYLIVLNFM